MKVTYSKPGSDHLETEEFDADDTVFSNGFWCIGSKTTARTVAMFNAACVVKIDFGKPSDPEEIGMTHGSKPKQKSK